MSMPRGTDSVPRGMPQGNRGQDGRVIQASAAGQPPDQAHPMGLRVDQKARVLTSGFSRWAATSAGWAGVTPASSSSAARPVLGR